MMIGRSASRWTWAVLAGIAIIAFLAGTIRTLRIPSHAVGIVDVQGAMTSSREVIENLDAARQHRRMKAVVLRINSPGGNVAVAQDIYDAVQRVRDAGKPVVAAIGSVGASGGYYVALAAQEIWIQPGSLTGSIGVIYERWDVSGLAGKLGISRNAMTAGAYKDVGSLWRQPTAAETKMMRNMLADIYQQFVDAVSLRRGLDAAAVPSVAEGRVWTGRQAVSLGLADRLGSWQSAAQRAAELAGLPLDTPVEEVRTGGWLDAIQRGLGTASMTKLAGLEWAPVIHEPWSLPRWQWSGARPPAPAGIQIW